MFKWIFVQYAFTATLNTILEFFFFNEILLKLWILDENRALERNLQQYRQNSKESYNSAAMCLHFKERWGLGVWRHLWAAKLRALGLSSPVRDLFLLQKDRWECSVFSALPWETMFLPLDFFFNKLRKILPLFYINMEMYFFPSISLLYRKFDLTLLHLPKSKNCHVENHYYYLLLSE